MHHFGWKRIVLQRPQGQLEDEEGLLKQAAQDKGIPVYEAGAKEMNRGRVQLSADDLVFGTTPFTLDAMRQLGITPPSHAPYPSSLKPWFHRKINHPTPLSNVMQYLEQQGCEIFIKPAEGWKRFTGFVASTSTDHRFMGASLRSFVWTSEVVKFVSEWRCYCANGKLLDVQIAPNENSFGITHPSWSEILQMYMTLRDAGQAIDGFVMDVGILDTGELALVEVNDGFSFGAYGNVTSDTMYEVVSARWKQLLRHSFNRRATDAVPQN